jgi:hypothetical protein
LTASFIGRRWRNTSETLLRNFPNLEKFCAARKNDYLRAVIVLAETSADVLLKGTGALVPVFFAVVVRLLSEIGLRLFYFCGKNRPYKGVKQRKPTPHGGGFP